MKKIFIKKKWIYIYGRKSGNLEGRVGFGVTVMRTYNARTYKMLSATGSYAGPKFIKRVHAVSTPARFYFLDCSLG